MGEQYCTNCGNLLRPDAKFCSSCGARIERISPPVVETPRAPATTKHPMSSRAKLIYSAVAIILFAAFTYTFVRHIPGGAHPVIAAQPEVAMATAYTGQTLQQQPIGVTVSGGKISFPLSALLERKIVEFEYETPTHTVPLLAYISAEGKLVTSVRMCEPCNSKTFRIEGTELCCGNCETRWNVNTLEGIQGSCQKYPPDPIPSTLVGNQVVIDEAAVKNWKLRI
jgi:predicted amidophosphoribosyltransferase